MSTAYPILILPSLKYLGECFTFRSDRPHWKRRPVHHFASEHMQRSWNKRYAGKPVGANKPDGYCDVGINGVLYKLHRVVWKLKHRKEPPEFLDHKDRDRGNNKIKNLRRANRTQQKHNSKTYKNNRLGVRGVSKRGDRYIARIKDHGVMLYLGSFATIKAASAAYQREARRIHRQFYRG